MRKIGVVLPEAAFRNGKRVDNLKDYQNVRWLTEILFEAGAKKNKLWPDESNLFIVTTIGSKGQIEV